MNVLLGLAAGVSLLRDSSCSGTWAGFDGAVDRVRIIRNMAEDYRRGYRGTRLIGSVTDRESAVKQRERR